MPFIVDDDIVVFIEAKGFVEGAPEEVTLLKIRLYCRQTAGGQEYRRIRIYLKDEELFQSEVFHGCMEFENVRDLFLQIVSGGDKITPKYLERLLFY